VRLAGLREEFTIPLSEGAASPLLDGPAPSQPSLEEALAQHTFLSSSLDERVLTVKPGVWDVQGDLIMPAGVGLFIPPGRTLRFEEGAVLFSTGPLTLLGTEQQPILLTAQDDGWGGIVVSEAETESIWKYARVEKTRGILHGGWILTGGITFYQSDVTLDHTRILGSEAEDGINVIQASFEFRWSEFGETSSDAFDGDFASGGISDSSFHDMGGDANR
jgi:hypothetical protein